MNHLESNLQNFLQENPERRKSCFQKQSCKLEANNLPMKNCNFQHVLLGRAHTLPWVCLLHLCWGSVSFLLVQALVTVMSPKRWDFFIFFFNFDPKEPELQQVESGFVKTASPLNFSLLQAVCRCQKHGKVVKLF